MGIMSKIRRLRRGSSSLKPSAEDIEMETRQGEECFPINDLPQPVFHEIVSKLDWETKKTCRLVCSDWEKFLRTSIFREENICCEYRAGEGPRGVTTAAIWHEIFGKFYKTRKPKLQFYTFRMRNITRLSVPFFQRWLFVKSLCNFSLKVKYVTRLELDPSLTVTNLSDDARVYEIWNILLPVFSNFENMAELIIAQPGTNDSAFPLPAGFLLFTDDLTHRFDTLSRKYKKDLKKLKRLKVFIYSVDLPKISEYVVFLQLIGNCAKSLTEFKVQVNYSQILTADFASNGFYSAIGNILKNNASTLVKVHLGTLNVDLGHRSYPGHPIVTKNYSAYTSNQVFDRLLDQMDEKEWRSLGLNELEQLTIDLPLPVLPSPRIETTLLPFLHSLQKLKVVKIQPIVRSRSTSLPPYLNTIFPKSAFSSYYPRMESDIIFFSNSTCCDWQNVRENCHHSVIDLVFKEYKRKEYFNSKPRSYHERNLSWENTLFSKSIISKYLPFLTKLIIFQDISTCPKAQQVYIGNAEMQLILRDGKHLQNLTLNCNMDDLTHIGYTGLAPVALDLFKYSRFIPTKYSRKLQNGYAMRDLKCLRHLTLFGLKGHHQLPGSGLSSEAKSRLRNINNSFWEDKADVLFIAKYFNSMNLNTLNLRYELSFQFGESFPKYRYIYTPFPNPLLARNV